MDSDLIVALLVPWVFWGIMAALLCYAQRSWINVLLIALLINIPLLVVAAVASSRDAMWFSLLLHLGLLIYFLFSYIGFVLRERKQRKN